MGFMDFIFKKESIITEKHLTKWAGMFGSTKSGPITSSPGFSALSVGDFDRAIKEFTTSIKFGKQKEEPYILRGLAYVLKGDGKKAIKDACSAQKINRTNCESYLIRAMGRCIEAKMPDAIDDFKKAVALDLHGSGRIGKIAQEAIDLIES